jgi:hypothetical protein
MQKQISVLERKLMFYVFPENKKCDRFLNIYLHSASWVLNGERNQGEDKARVFRYFWTGLWTEDSCGASHDGSGTILMRRMIQF